MNNGRWLLAVAALILNAALLLAKDSANVPDLVLLKDGDTMWISTDLALKSDHTLNQQALGMSADFLRSVAKRRSDTARTEQLATPSGTAQDLITTPDAATAECDGFLSLPPGKASDPNTLPHDANVIVTGRVTAVKEGFFFNTPGSLLAIVGTALKGSLSAHTYLLFYPYARIKTADGLMCAGANLAPPQPNDRVLVFSRATPMPVRGDSPVLYVDIEHDVVYQSHDALSLPSGLRAGASPSFDLIVKETQQTLARDRRAQ